SSSAAWGARRSSSCSLAAHVREELRSVSYTARASGSALSGRPSTGRGLATAFCRCHRPTSWARRNWGRLAATPDPSRAVWAAAGTAATGTPAGSSPRYPCRGTRLPSQPRRLIQLLQIVVRPLQVLLHRQLVRFRCPLPGQLPAFPDALFHPLAGLQGQLTQVRRVADGAPLLLEFPANLQDAAELDRGALGGGPDVVLQEPLQHRDILRLVPQGMAQNAEIPLAHVHPPVQQRRRLQGPPDLLPAPRAAVQRLRLHGLAQPH